MSRRFLSRAWGRRSPARILFAVVVATIVAAPTVAFASHFRYGNASWKPGAGTNEIDIQMNQAARRSYPIWSGSGADGMPVPGDAITSDFTLDFGDGTIVSSYDMVVTSIDTTDDWLFAATLDPNRPSGDNTDTTVNHTYPAPGNYTVVSQGCCRVGQTSTNYHVNNPDGSQRFETLVNVGTGNTSPVTTLPPIVKCPINGMCSFQVPASDPNGDTLRYRLSTAEEASGFAGGFTQPGAPHAPNNATIDVNTGMYTWDTTGATLSAFAGANTLYSTQVMIEDLDGSGAVKSKVALDFIIELTEDVGEPPVFDASPVCGTTQNVGPGSTLSYTISGSDPDVGSTVTINAAGVPVGATHNPPLPAEGNPVSADFSWTPTPGQEGSYVITYTVTDDAGQQALCSLTIVVEEDGPEIEGPAGDPTCSDAVDNDGDGLTDGDDPNCQTEPENPCDEPGAILGTSGNDVIRGTRGDDIICGLEGDDFIRSGPGDDMIFGNEGNDRLVGGSGDDLMEGNEDNDRLRGGTGDDTADGNEGRDRVTGQTGDDNLTGGAGTDGLRGGDGSDTCDAGGDPGDRAEGCEA